MDHYRFELEGKRFEIPYLTAFQFNFRELLVLCYHYDFVKNLKYPTISDIKEEKLGYLTTKRYIKLGVDYDLAKLPNGTKDSLLSWVLRGLEMTETPVFKRQGKTFRRRTRGERILIICVIIYHEYYAPPAMLRQKSRFRPDPLFRMPTMAMLLREPQRSAASLFNATLKEYIITSWTYRDPTHQDACVDTWDLPLLFENEGSYCYPRYQSTWESTTNDTSTDTADLALFQNEISGSWPVRAHSIGSFITHIEDNVPLSGREVPVQIRATLNAPARHPTWEGDFEAWSV